MNTPPLTLTAARPADGGRLDRLLRAGVRRQLDALGSGTLVLRDAQDTRSFGQGGDGLSAAIEVRDAAFYRAVALRGSVGAAESFIEGNWHCDDLVALVRILVRNRDALDAMERGWARIGGNLLRLAHALRPNTLAGSRRNIAAHYDLGNDFFRLFLSSDLMYSSALWAAADDTLEQASTRKLQRVCAALELGPDDHLLEIGTGWGGLAIHAARTTGCRVTTTTISREQQRLAIERVAEAGLSSRVTVLLEDYRHLEGRYDKLVSIEMIEAIGARHLRTYFGQIGRLLEPEGLALVQAITIEDHRYEQARRSVDFIKRHVFPGSFIPSIAAMLEAKTRASDLALIRLEDFGDSYARTLAAWRERFLARRAEARRLGFDERFLRLWEFYLAYCEGGFRERSIGVAHLLFARPGYRSPGARPQP